MNRIGIVFPWGTVDAHPSVGNAAVLLAQAGYSVDLFVRRDATYRPPTFDEPGIRVLTVGLDKTPRRASRGRVDSLMRFAVHFVEEVSLAARLSVRHFRSPYGVVIGVDPLGLALAHRAAQALRVPLVYFSFELLLQREASSWRQRRLKAAERRASRDVRFALVQDEERAAVLSTENGIPLERCMLVPNAPLGEPEEARSRRWHREFGLPPDERVVLHAGSVAPFTGVDEILASTRTWPSGWSLVVHASHSLHPAELERFRAVSAPGRVHFSTSPVSRDEVDDLFAAADVGIAFYVVPPDAMDENHRTVGLSSGKVAYSLRAGLPVIVNEGTTLADFVRDEGCGVAVHGGADVGEALSVLGGSYDRYSEAAVRAYRERFDFARSFAKVLDHLDRMSARAVHQEEPPRV